MASPEEPPASLGSRLAAAGASAAHETELGIARARAWCLVVALVQTALYPGEHWYLAWGAMALLTLTTIWSRWSLEGEGAGTVDGTDGRPSVIVVGIVAMAADTIAATMVMANLMASPDDPIQLLPLALAVEAAVRWDRLGGIVGGIAGGLLMTGWSVAVHARNDLDVSIGYAAFRFGVLVLIASVVGHAVREMRRQRRAAEAVFQASRDLMATFTADGRLLAANPACEELLGYSAEELKARDRALFLDPVVGLAPGELGTSTREGAQRVVRQVERRDGSHAWLELDLVPDPRAGLLYAIGRDISDRSRAESELRHRVDHDGLTGAWNRPALVAYLHRMLSRGYRPALVFIDLDRFKEVNDVHGHLVGDAVIIEMGERLREAAAHDGSVARYGGDEFCVVVDDPDDVHDVAERIGELLGQRFYAEGRELDISASVGVAESRAGDTPETLVHRADQAMYAVKRSARLPL